MSNPVMQALAAARLRQINVQDDSMAATVRKVIGPTPYDDTPPSELFRSWCETKGTSELPAATSAVAAFVLENVGLGIEALLAHIKAVAAAHHNSGLADPTLSWPVTAALDTLTEYQMPRSWPKEQRPQWLQLSGVLKAYMVKREEQRDAAVRKSQNEAADLRKQLAEIQKQETTNETQTVNA